MSHEFETGFVVREPAWHGLGTVVKEAPTSADALRLAGLDWTVEKKPIYNGEHIEIPGFKANTRSSDNSILGIVSDRYQIVQNAEAFEFTDALVGEGLKYESAGSLRDGKTIWLLGKLDTVKILDDDIETYICFANQHDGKGAVKVCLTPTRVVCQNTLNFALNTAKRSWTTRHIGDIESKMAEAAETLGLAKTYMNNLGITADEFAHTKIENDQIAHIINELFPIDENDTDRKKRNMTEMREGLWSCMFAPDLIKFLNTKWGVVNAAADFVDHKLPKRNTESYKENNWARIMDGHYIVDTVFDAVSTI